MKVMVFYICGPLMKYKNMLLSWLDFYKDGFRYVRKELASNIIQRSATCKACIQAGSGENRQVAE